MIREPEKIFQQMMVAIADSLRHPASLDNGQDTKDKDDEDTELGKVSDVDEPG
jgi:hypothetical protein